MKYKKQTNYCVCHIGLNSGEGAAECSTYRQWPLDKTEKWSVCNNPLKSIFFKSASLSELPKTHLHTQINHMHTQTRLLTDWVVIWP